MDFASRYNRMVLKLLGRSLRRRDGSSERKIREAEKRLDIKLPLALREYHRVAGNLAELNKQHNQLLDLSDLVVEEGHLIFMHENQWVVSWGIRIEDLSCEDPAVWQRNNSEPIVWRAEELTVSEFIAAMLLWQSGVSEDEARRSRF
ncbi:MAG: SMI1/KNR4 family protein [Acidobacteriota bacterium]